MSTYMAEYYNRSLIRPLQNKADYSRWKIYLFHFSDNSIFLKVLFFRETVTFLDHLTLSDDLPNGDRRKWQDLLRGTRLF